MMIDVQFDGAQLAPSKMEISIAQEIVRPQAVGMRIRPSFYKQHELAIWFAVVLIELAAAYLCLNNDIDLIWQLSTPLVRYIP